MIEAAKRNLGRLLLLSGLCCLLAACAKSNDPLPSRETNWLTLCDSDGECVDSDCVCGLCSLSCSASENCGAGARCQADDSVLVRAACGAAPSVPGLCAPECTGDAECGQGQSCVQGACAPLAELDAGLGGGAPGLDAGP
ncbi:MAG: hypothetical protein OEZ06_32335 [Myxococcales bacterium]|nr:hypothetical protein [Myxococcales bacterium]